MVSLDTVFLAQNLESCNTIPSFYSFSTSCRDIILRKIQGDERRPVLQRLHRPDPVPYMPYAQITGKDSLREIEQGLIMNAR